MIKALDILNFQVHRNLHMDFCSGVNVITGSSDSGKTAIMRGLKWLITNRPSGDAFKNWNASPKEPVAIEVTLDDDQIIGLSREGGKNTYILNEDSFSAFKTDVPEEIVNVLNIQEGNIQSQHQDYFLLQDSPGEVARKLNDLVGLSIIDTIFKNINSKIRQVSSDITFFKNDRNKLEQELLQYENLDKIEKLITNIEKNEATASGLVSSLNDLRKNVSTLASINLDREKLCRLTNIEAHVDKIVHKVVALECHTKTLRDLKLLFEAIKFIQQSREEESLWLELEPHCIALQEKVDTAQKNYSKKAELAGVLVGIASYREGRRSSSLKLTDLINSYVNIITDNRFCPTCYNTIDDDEISRIKDELYGGMN